VVAACKGGTPAGSNIPDHSGPLTEMVLLGNLAVRDRAADRPEPQTGAVLPPGVPEEFPQAAVPAGVGMDSSGRSILAH